ncbi:MAG: phage tail protein [Bacillus sp. (in: firmicutes)]
MLVVSDLNGNTEALTDVHGVEINEEVNADFSISFTSFFLQNNAHSYPLLQEESIIALDGHEYRVKQMTEVRNGKSIKAPHVFFDLIDKRKDDVLNGVKTANEVFNFLLIGTGWTFQIVGSIPSQTFNDFGNKNVLELIRKACEIFECEIKIETGKRLIIQTEIGVDRDEQFRYKHNIKTLKRNVDTSNLTTCIKGTGAEGLSVIYKSTNVSKYGERWAEPVSDERYTSVTSLTERLQREIQDVPEISIDVEVISLGIDAGLGDKVWTIYEPLNIEFQTRAIAIKRYPFSNRSPIVSLSNRQQTITDFLAETKQEIEEDKEEAEKRFKSKIEAVEDRITLEVEELETSISRIELQADNIEISVNNRITNEVAAINMQANNIALSVQRVDDRVGNAESQIYMQAGQIQSKVEQADFNGEMIKSLITQTATTVQIDARHIALRGEVTSDNIQVGNEIRLGNSSWGNAKSLIFNNSTYLSADGDRLDVYAANYVNFYATTAFRGGIEGAVGTRSDQRVSVSFDSDLSMVVTVNGRTAKFKPV